MARPALIDYAMEQQRTDELLAAIDDWRTSVGQPQHARDRRWAMSLLAVHRARRDLRRAEVHAAVNRHNRNLRRAA
jgi:hypothetical protein